MAAIHVLLLCLMFHMTTVLANEMCPSNFTLSDACNCTIDQDTMVVECNYTNRNEVEKVLYNNTVAMDIHFDKLILSGLDGDTLPDNFLEGTSVSAIDARNNNFQEVPKAFQNMQRLTVLDLSHNNMETFNLSWISSLTNLTRLHLAFNSISTLSDEGPSVSTILDFLDLSQNSLSQIQPNSKLWTNVKYLDLSHNMLSSIGPSQDSNIMILNLAGNQFTTVTNENFFKFPKLEFLNISTNVIEVIQDGGFNGLDNLHKLDLFNNRLSNIGADIFTGLKTLAILNISNNSLQVLSSGIFSGLSFFLKELHLAGNDLRTISTDTFQDLSDLKLLNLSRNSNLKDIGEVIFPSHLLYLDLSHCAVSEIDDCQFKNMVDLQMLDLRGNQLTCSCHLSWLYTWQQQNQGRTSLIQTVISPLWYCQDSQQNTVQVDRAALCPDHDPLMSHCPDLPNSGYRRSMNISVIHLNMTTEVSDDVVILKWQADDTWEFYGFRVVIPSDNTPDDLFVSTILHRDARTYSLSFSDRSEYQVCLQILRNATSMMFQHCESVSSGSMAIIVGVLAGTVFLVPCMAALSYVIYRDRAKRMEEDYSKLDLEDIEKQSVASHSESQPESEKGPLPKGKGHPIHTPKESPTGRPKGQKKVTIKVDGDTINKSETRPESGRANLSYVADPADIATHVCSDSETNTSEHLHGSECKHHCDHDPDNKTVCVKF